MTHEDLWTPSARKTWIAFLGLWGLATGYLAATGEDWTFPIVSLVLFGAILSAVVWLLTRGIVAKALTISAPRRESRGLLGYLLVYALAFIAFGLGALKAAVAPGPMQEIAVLAYKLAIHVALPVALIAALGGTVRGLFSGIVGGWRWWRCLIVLSAMFFCLLAIVSPSLEQIDELGFSPAVAVLAVLASWAWLSLEAGLCEEVLFRGLLQSRVAAWLQSPVAAICIVSILFGLAHAPGLYWRGGPEVSGWSTDPLAVVAYTIAALSPMSVMIGVLWQRTGSLLMVVLVHAAVDAMPNTAELVRAWT